MRIRELKIRNFRGIESLDWRPSSSLVCIVGPGDTGKSTILDAIEVTLSSRWLQVSDADFPRCDTSKTIEIVVTVGELPEEVLRDGRMGLHLRGWSATGELHDEPEDDDEAVVSVRLTVDSSLEPVWELVTDRNEPRTLSGRDRGLFGVVRLGGDAERHLTWGHGSGLARLSTDKGTASTVLADAYRKARELVAEGTISGLNEVATKVHKAAVRLGAYSATPYLPGLDTQRASMSLGALALHEFEIPVRLAGLGTRRLVTLAIQRLAIPEGAIILIDELEHGLEPHRIRRALKDLREGLAAGNDQAGHVIMTTHSSTTIVELSAVQLSIAVRGAGAVALRPAPATLQAIVRRVPEAFLARRVIVCEGKTEVGLLRALRDLWSSRHSGEPLEYRGVVLIDGGGSEAPRTAAELARLGYETALFRDSDVALKPEEDAELKALKTPVLEWPDACATEARVFRDVGDAAVQELLEVAYQSGGIESVRDSVRAALETTNDLPRDFASWNIPGRTRQDLRLAVAQAATKMGWFKRIDTGEQLGALVAKELSGGLNAPLATLLGSVEAWAYG